MAPSAGEPAPAGAGTDSGVSVPAGAGTDPGVSVPAGAGTDPGVSVPAGAAFVSITFFWVRLGCSVGGKMGFSASDILNNGNVYSKVRKYAAETH